MVSYHTGAGLGDATFIEERTAAAAKGFLEQVNGTTIENNNYQAFNLGNAFPWQMSKSTLLSPVVIQRILTR